MSKTELPIYNKVRVGNVLIGKGEPIIVQTMCNTATQDIVASYDQCLQLHKAGADIIRLTTQGIKEIDALKVIKSKLRNVGITTPLVADVHFSSDVAIAAASVADKVRINPGNFSVESEKESKFKELINVCKEHGTAIRIGVNHGSLGERIIERFGDTPLGMAEAAKEWIDMAAQNSFTNIVVSLKSSNTRVMIEAYRILSKMMESAGVYYPLHLGVTEAGNGNAGRIKSAVGIATLLSEDIGDTIRVSLTESPVNELPVAIFIAKYLKNRMSNLSIVDIDSNTIENGQKKILSRSYREERYEEFILKAACDIGPLLIDNRIDDLSIWAECGGKTVPNSDIELFREDLLQASRRKFSKPEYIACPGCGRTLFDIEKTFEEVKNRTSHLVGYNIAVMGCIVNGPGEMADADYGYVGEGRGKVSIYRGKTPIYRAVPQNEAIDKLLSLIDEDARSRVFLPRA